MTERIRRHYLSTGAYTQAGPYEGYLRSLHGDVEELGRLVCAQVIHRVTLREGNTGANSSLLYGDMERFPWHRMRCEDDIFLTAPAMLAELFRLDNRGLVACRKVEHKLVVTCRYVAVLMAAVLKARGIPCRCRAGFAPYFDDKESGDHWINQYWDDGKGRWVTFDADGFYHKEKLGFDPYDIPRERFDWAADAWLGIRGGKTDGGRFVYAGGACSLEAVIRAVFYDFHSLMNNEISYRFQPAYLDEKFHLLSEGELCEIDKLCLLLREPDENFGALRELWRTRRKFRILNSPLVGDWDHGRAGASNEGPV